MAKKTYDHLGYSVPEELEYLKEEIYNLKKELSELKEKEKKEVVVDFITLTDTAKEPTQEHDGDLWDIYADEDMLIVSGESKLVSTGLAYSIPYGYQLRLHNRSSGPLKCKLVLSNGTGIIDTQYTGEIKGQFFTISGAYEIKKGDKIMQLELVKLIKVKFRKVKKLPKTDRGANGFGSSGK